MEILPVALPIPRCRCTHRLCCGLRRPVFWGLWVPRGVHWRRFHISIVYKLCKQVSYCTRGSTPGALTPEGELMASAKRSEDGADDERWQVWTEKGQERSSSKQILKENPEGRPTKLTKSRVCVSLNNWVLDSIHN